MTLRCCISLIASCLLLACASSAGTAASFRGRVVEATAREQKPGLIYILGNNGSLRKVQTEGAQVSYSQQVPRSQRDRQPAEKALKHGAEVRVVAEENGAGVWLARSIEILRLSGAKARAGTIPPESEPSHNQPSLSRRTL
jgi:hypothetical protein